MESKEKISSKYKGVCYHYNNASRSKNWALNCWINGTRAFKLFPFSPEGEKQAAICYDTIRINNGKEPINILRKK